MKILIYSHAFAPQIGGIETFSMYLAEGLAAIGRDGIDDGFEVVVVTQTPAVSDERSLPIPFLIVRQPGVLRLWGLVGNIDKVLLAGPAILPLLFALLRRKPVILTHHGYQSICPNGMLFHFPTQRSCPGHFAAGNYLECLKCNAPQEKLAGSARLLLLNLLRRLLARWADHNVAVSEHVANRIALPKSVVIRNAVADAPARSQCGAFGKQNPTHFAYIGRLVTEKGVPVLVAAAKILKQRGKLFRILIIGDGPQRDGLREQVAASNLTKEVEFLGFRRGAELDALMNNVSALIMPSICEDAAPFSVLEQMMRGRLVIGSRLGGLAEEIGEAGLTFADGDAQALAHQMERVISDPEIVGSCGKKARERAKEFYTLSRMITEYQELFRCN